MNGAYSGTLARLAMASGIVIVQERFTIGATSWRSFSCGEASRLDGGQGFYGHRRPEQSVARWCSGQA